MPNPGILRIAERWFARETVGADITLLWEAHVSRALRCNIWHLRGRERDLIIDSGMGIASLWDATRDLIEKPVLAVATHTHFDHIGGHHEFQEVAVHRAELTALTDPSFETTLFEGGRFTEDTMRAFRDADYRIPEEILTALPHAGYDLADYRIKPAKVTRVLQEGDAIDTGDRHFQVLHLPGHSPGSIALFEQKSGILFSGDVIYDGTLLDSLDHSDKGLYRESMERLLGLPVTLVHAGHEPSFDGRRLRQLIAAYLDGS